MREVAVHYKPTMGMIRELARAGLGDPVVETVARWACRQRGLLNCWGQVTTAGHVALARAARQSQAHA